MKIKTYKSLFLTLGFIACLSCRVASAQEASPSPAQTPAVSSKSSSVFVCLKGEYVDAVKTTGVVLDTRVIATLVRFDGDFAVFKRPESPALVYIPKSAILYISAKPDPKILY